LIDRENSKKIPAATFYASSSSSSFNLPIKTDTESKSKTEGLAARQHGKTLTTALYKTNKKLQKSAEDYKKTTLK